MRKVVRALFGVMCAMTFAASHAFAADVPSLKGRVNDYADLLSPADEQKLEESLKLLEQKTTAQVVVLTIKDLDGEDIDPFSMRVVESWKLGQKGKDNGLLITYAVAEDVYRIEVGYGLEGAISDGVAGDIIRDFLRKHANPKEETRDFNQAFTTATNKIAEIILAEYEKDPSGESLKGTSKETNAVVVMMAIALFIAGVIGQTHYLAGGATGTVGGAVVSLIMAFEPASFVVMMIVGFILGCIAPFFLEAMAEGGGSGGGFGGSGGSSRGGGGFGGGGGGFGGGGARG